MMLKPMFAAVVLALGTCSGAAAQQLSPEADFAYWCDHAVYYLLELDRLTVPVDKALQHFADVQYAETARLKLSDEQIGALNQSYFEEVSMQMQEYLQGMDPDALRFDLNQCLHAG